MLLSTRTSRRIPNQPRKVPKVNRTIIGNNERFAVDFFVVERGCGRVVGGEQGARREEVGVGYVLDVGEIKEVVIVAHLVPVAALAVDVDDVEGGLDVAFAHDASWADGGCEELGVVDAVGVEDDLFGSSLAKEFQCLAD